MNHLNLSGQPLRLGLVIGRYDAEGGGAERATDRLARWLIQQNIEVHLLARSFRGEPIGATCHAIDPEKGSLKGERQRFAEVAERTLRALNLDLIHDMGDGWYSDLFMPHHGTRRGGFVRNSALLPAFVRPMRNLISEWLPRYRDFWEVERRQYDWRERPDRPRTIYIALSEMVATHMTEYYQVPRERIRIVPNGVDTNAFRMASPEEPARLRLRREWQADDQTTVFLLVAHNFRLKGLDAALAALARLRRHGERCQLVVVGNGWAAPYRMLARQWRIDDAVIFAGNQPCVEAYYAACDVYLQPTFYDPCSLVVLEAMACGRPVVTTKWNGAAELLGNLSQSLVIPDPSDLNALTASMHRLLNPKLRGEIGRTVRLQAEKYTLTRQAEALLAIYAETARRQRRAA